ASEVEAIDLLDTAGAPLLKRLIPVLSGLAAVLVALFLRRRRRARRSSDAG
ncbi:MAG: carbon monoxide dehydrogenase, partial [Pseudonocardiales bacterium]|nr:carbon monoxide dehydrogenase [Pseudonocardiales bacterium]